MDQALSEMVGLRSIEKELKNLQPFRNINITGCIHITPYTGVLIQILKNLGAQVNWTNCKYQRVHEDVIAELCLNNQANIFAWENQTYMEYFECLKRSLQFANGQGPNYIIDDQGVLSEFIHIAKDAEAFYQTKKIIPDLQQLGWDVYGQHSSALSQIDKSQRSLSKKQTYFETLNQFIRKSLEQDSTYFTRYSRNIKGATDDTLVGQVVWQKIRAQSKLLFPCIKLNQGERSHTLAYMIPEAISKIISGSVAGKVIGILGFNIMGEKAARALRDAKASVIIFENETQNAINAKHQGFDIHPSDFFFQNADVILKANQKMIKFKHFQKMKNNAYLGSIETEQFDFTIETEELNSQPTIQLEIIKTNLQKYTFPEGKSIYIIAEGKPISMTCSTNESAIMASNSFCTHIKSLLELHSKQQQYSIDIYEIPQYIQEQVDLLHLDYQNNYDSEEEQDLQNFISPSKNKVIQQAQSIRPIYQEKKMELQRLQKELEWKQISLNQITDVQKEVTAEDLVKHVEIGNIQIEQVKKDLIEHRKILEELKNLKMERVDLWPIIEKSRNILLIQMNALKQLGPKENDILIKKEFNQVKALTDNLTKQNHQSEQLKGLLQTLEASQSLAILNENSEKTLNQFQLRILEEVVPLKFKDIQYTKNQLCEVEIHLYESLKQMNLKQELEKSIL